MEETQNKIKDFFPIIQQNIRDVYNADCILLEAPFSDFTAVDRGFRKMVWGQYNTDNSAFFRELRDRLIVIKSTLHFTNVMAVFTGKDGYDKMISIGPFREEDVTFLEEVMRENNLMIKNIDMLRGFYTSIPKVHTESVVVTFKHLLEYVAPQFHTIEPDYLLFSETDNKIELDVNMLGQYTVEQSEEHIKVITDLLETIPNGNVSESFDKYKAYAESIMADDIHSVLSMKKMLSILNALISVELSRKYVHPYYCIQTYQNLENVIKNSSSLNACKRIPYDMVHKYCLLVKNYHHKDYSYLIKRVVDYINLHLDENLTLAALAERFEKNPSYLSKQFHDETGVSLTGFVQSERIRMAVKLFNTTQMSVSEVALHVGIPDFGYFSKQFKKQIGVSPREYCIKIRIRDY